MGTKQTIFFSYSRDDSDFVLSLAKDLRKAGATIWLDQLDIEAGSRWDSSIEKALANSHVLLVVLSCSSVISNNVLDEVSYALEENKLVVPVLLETCDIPFRLRRLQYADFTEDRKTGIETLIKALELEKNVATKLVDVAEETSRKHEDFKKNVPKSEQTIKPGTPNNNSAERVQQVRTYPQHSSKSSNSLLYIIGGIIVGVGMVVFLIIVIAAALSADTSDPEPINLTDDTSIGIDEESGTDNLSTHEQDWNLAQATNTVEGYMTFLYKYGKNSSSYNQVYNNIRTLLPNTSYAVYGQQHVERYYNRQLYYYGDETTAPQKDDIVVPIYQSPLYTYGDPEGNGLFVQPNQKLLVEQVSVDDNNFIWMEVRY